MRIYISHSSEYDYVNKVYNLIKNSNLNESNNFVFPHESKITNTKDVIANSDLVIAEVSIPSTGQGIELGWANYCKTPIVCIYEKGAEISSSLKFITNNFIEYEDVTDMIDKIKELIQSFK